MRRTSRRNPFDAGAAEYDAWYDADRGRAVFRGELACLTPLVVRPGSGATGSTLEVGVGSGRFAEALGISVGLDPSVEMLRVAATRPVQPVRGVGEALPFCAGAFDLVLFVTTIEFVADAVVSLREAARVIQPGGLVVVGFLPAAGAWAAQYRAQAAAGPSVFASARFFSAEQLEQAAEDAGLVRCAARSALLSGPAAPPEPEAVSGVVPDAGFVGMGFQISRSGQHMERSQQ